MLTTWDVSETGKLSQRSVTLVEHILYAITRRPARDTLALLPTNRLDAELYTHGFDRAMLEIFDDHYHWDFRTVLRELYDGKFFKLFTDEDEAHASAAGRAFILNIAVYLLGYLVRLPDHLPEYKSLGVELLNSLEKDGYSRQQLIPTAVKQSFSADEAALDAVTGVPGRKHFDDALKRELHSASDLRPLSLVIVDLDHFKAVNDMYGHPTGDLVLRTVARTLQSVVEGRGGCYRYGGEELVLILPNFAVEEACALAERARLTLSNTKPPGGPERVTASFGVATFPHTTALAGELIAVADKALYEAKKSGRNRVCTWRAGDESSTPLI